MARCGCCDHVHIEVGLQPYAYYEQAQTAGPPSSACPCERNSGPRVEE